MLSVRNPRFHYLACPAFVANELPEYFCDLPEWAKRAVMGHLTKEFPGANPEQVRRALNQAAKSTGATCNLAACLASASMLLREAGVVEAPEPHDRTAVLLGAAT